MRIWVAAALALAALATTAATASAQPVRLRFAVPAGYVERATLVMRVTRSTRSGVVVEARHRRIAFQRGPIRRGRMVRLDVTRAIDGSPMVALSVRSMRGEPVRMARGDERPRLVTGTTNDAQSVPVVPAGEPELVPAASPDPVVATPPPPAPTTPAPPEPDATQRAVVDLLGDVKNADGVRYAAVDDRALPLDGLKIVESAPGAYVGIYHSLDAGMFRLKVATSRDLLNWHWRADLDTSAAQGTIVRAADGSYLVAYEKSAPNEVRLRFRGYDSLEALLTGAYSREFTAPRTLAPTAEGTPNIESVDGAKITVGFHYYRNADVDRQARGVLTDFSSWSTEAAPELDALFEPFAVAGNIGDRDWFELDGHAYAVQEAQGSKDDWGSWRTYLVDRESSEAFPIDTRTAGGSRAFGNPTATIVTVPSGKPAIVVTQFVFSEGAAPGEAGSLIYFRLH